jgi:hypothetical protein
MPSKVRQKKNQMQTSRPNFALNKAAAAASPPTSERKTKMKYAAIA